MASLRRWILCVLALALLTPLCACRKAGDLPASGTSEPPQTDALTLEARLRARFPEYFDLETGKGLEVYVWQMAEDSYSCGVLPGTNRYKTDEELWDLAKNPATVGEMNAILNCYGIPRKNVFVTPIHQPISSYMYDIDEAYLAAVRAMFE